MTTNSFYSLTCSLVIGLFAMSSFNFSSSPDFENLSSRQTGKIISLFEDTEKVHQDTTPRHSGSRETYRTKDNKQNIYLSIEDGEIQELKINGKEIPKRQYGNYTDFIVELRSSNNTLTSPIPPTPPRATMMGEIEKAREEIERAHREIEAAHKEIEAAHQQIANTHLEIEKNHSTSEAFAQALIEDGLIKNEQRYDFYLTKKKFKVDGKVQDKATHQKYLKLYEKLTGGKMNENSTYQVSHNNS